LGKYRVSNHPVLKLKNKEFIKSRKKTPAQMEGIENEIQDNELDIQKNQNIFITYSCGSI